jgi:hypothetical protein
VSRYGPSVLPQSFDLSQLSDAFLEGRDRKRRRRRDDATDARAQESHDLEYYERGGRRGPTPDEPSRRVTIPGAPDIPETLDFGTDDDVQDPPSARSALLPGSFDAALMAELTRGGPTGSGADQGFRTPLTPQLQDQGFRKPSTPAQRHPGAFDPATQTFGGSPLQMAVTAGSAAAKRGEQQIDLGPTGRYTTIDDNHYIDEFATPRHERAQDREAQLALSAAFRSSDITQRGDAAIALETLRQQGRQNLRDRMSAAALAAIQARGVEQRRTNEADPRPGRRAAAGGAGGVKPQTGNSREANAIRMADGVVSAAGGSYDAAVEWLESTEEGRSAQLNGLEKRHLYAALGKYLNAATDAATRMQTGASALEPEEAVQAQAQTRAAIAGRSQAKGTITQREYQALRQKGFTDAQIRAKYTITADTASPRQQGDTSRTARPD